MRLNTAYEIGDVVRVKDLQTLHEELGDPIHAQCGWVDGMNRYAGLAGTVIDRMYSTCGAGHYSYRINFSHWWFSEDTLCHDQPEPEPTIQLSYQELFNN